jgi:hypothetical protein
LPINFKISFINKDNQDVHIFKVSEFSEENQSNDFESGKSPTYINVVQNANTNLLSIDQKLTKSSQKVTKKAVLPLYGEKKDGLDSEKKPKLTHCSSLPEKKSILNQDAIMKKVEKIEGKKLESSTYSPTNTIPSAATRDSSQKIDIKRILISPSQSLKRPHTLEIISSKELNKESFLNIEKLNRDSNDGADLRSNIEGFRKINTSNLMNSPLQGLLRKKKKSSSKNDTEEVLTTNQPFCDKIDQNASPTIEVLKLKTDEAQQNLKKTDVKTNRTPRLQKNNKQSSFANLWKAIGTKAVRQISPEGTSKELY